MTPRSLHILTTAAPGGVADYTALLVEALGARGMVTRLWDVRAPLIRAQLAEALAIEPGPVLLQYVPGVLGRRGANIGFCLWLRSLRQKGTDVRVMFHEPYMYFTWHRPLQCALAVAQRLMAAVLLRASPVSYLSTERWRHYLAPYAPPANRFITLPIPTTIPPVEPAEGSAWRARLSPEGPLVGHFGTFGEHVATELAPALLTLLRERLNTRFVGIGRGSEDFVENLLRRAPDLAGRVKFTGTLPVREVAAVLAACDLVLQPYPDGVTTRRTSLMAPLAAGVAVVTSRGRLTESVWGATGAVALAPASDPAAHAAACIGLLGDERARRQLALRGRATYDTHFSMERTVDALLAGLGVPA